jgi:aminoglycoside 3-N-acetyltransferase
MDDGQRAEYIAAMPGFDVRTTPSTGMGTFAEHVRTSASTMRSLHPLTSFAATGPRAGECVSCHVPDCLLGEGSPLGWLYRAGAAVLLLGVGYDVCTAFHLAEYRLPRRVFRCYEWFVADGGERRTLEFTDIVLDDSDFGSLGEKMDSETFVRRGTVGEAECRLVGMRAAVDSALAWPAFREHRGVR